MNNVMLNDSLFESIMNVIGESVYIVDSEYRIVYVNEMACKTFFGGNDVLNRSIFDVFQNLERDSSTFVKVIATGIPIKEQITEYFDIEGRRRISISNTYPIVKNGQVIGAFEFGEDLTGINNLSEQLAQSRMIHPKENNKREVSRASKSPYYTLDSIIGESVAIKRLKEQILISSNSSSNLLIYGETGTGKELVAQAVFSLSKNIHSAPFIAFNCAAIPEALLEGILFGTVKGSFTGAENKPGLFECANGGVIFLDEINSMPLNLQAKILRVIQEGKVQRVGGQREIPVDFRLIASTNIAPQKILENAEMRSDLYYRLNVLNIDIPPLRDRKEDIPILADYFIQELNPTVNKNILGLHENAIELLMEYHWPGNIRELKNTIERSMNYAKEKLIGADEIKLNTPFSIKIKNEMKPPAGERVRLKETLSQIEIELIRNALRQSAGNIARAARDLDIPQQTLNSKIDKYKLRNFRRETMIK
ncbi:arginine utilization regulatory protein [Cytobacillus oceanisediminis]|uniref:Arginine utilization regulatory protein n=1 Tax=Cytobacillus oceanisediminis TaxID=665099 RepID=A0A2V3A3D7_9BACI|nr:sigma 54-interacting transcriptional regulator [Cytobacillus oceanisediminis]PWW31326.1 arginine utilization regulatory protein [Cytobacillus oceanisediminis]